tara:strand:- start:147 stop:287 length:141 start_codon:yes stop_codon:yes gene_type:complete
VENACAETFPTSLLLSPNLPQTAIALIAEPPPVLFTQQSVLLRLIN